MNKYQITLNKVRRVKDDSVFSDTYKKILSGDTLNEDEKFYLLKISILFINSDDANIEKLGYRIILRYTNVFLDYVPLYELAVLNDYIPIAKFIELNKLNKSYFLKSFSKTLVTAYQENFKSGTNSYYRSLGQLQLYSFANTNDNIAIVAPTSYGKSEMMRIRIRDHVDKKVCVIVPSKALLAQTKKLLMQDSSIRDGFEKIITHPEMFRGEPNFLAVFTQERLLKFIQDNKDIQLDLVMLDEAHNMLEKGHRAVLLVQVLLMLKARNPDLIVNYFTPFLSDTNSLRIVDHDFGISGKSTSENMKLEMFYGYNFRDNRGLFIYDQFLDEAVILNEYYHDELELINEKAGRKNILYLNRPRHAEEIAMRVAEVNSDIVVTNKLKKVIESISELVHPNYNLIDAIRKGVIYHHGAVPDMVRLYIEDVFTKFKELKFIVTTSTLLEGVNIPAEKIFILSPNKTPGYLSSAQFKNLIGRICRFNEVFDPIQGSLSGLEPEIYLCGIEKYSRKSFEPLRFYKERTSVSKTIEDKVVNPLLENSTNTDGRQATLEYMENMQQGSSGLSDVLGPETDLGKLCFEGNVKDFSILENETRLNENLELFKLSVPEKIDNAEMLIRSIYEIFISGIALDENTDNIARLRDHEQARSFYRMFINWRSRGSLYPVMINNFINYWNDIEDDVYIGKTWGEKKRGGFNELYVDMKVKTTSQKINLAIAKIKEEQDFVDFHIMKYIEILNDLEMVDNDFYDRVKYGTTNLQIICLLKNGFSLDLARRLVEGYSNFIVFDLDRNVVQYDDELISLMQENNENEILVFEARHNIAIY